MTKKRQVVPMDKFELIRCKVLESKGVDIAYTVKGDSRTYTCSSPEFPHNDLQILLDSLKPIVATVFVMDIGHKMINEKTFDATKNQKLFLENSDNEMKDRVTVTGVSLTGNDDKMGAVITSVFDSLQGGIAINTKRIMFTGTKLGIEEEVEETCEEIRKEAYQYIFNGKKHDDGQTKMFESDDKEESSDFVVEGNKDETNKGEESKNDKKKDPPSLD